MNKITMMEIIMMSITVVVSTAVLFATFLSADLAGQDAWISVILAGMLAVVPVWAAGVVMARFPDQSIIQAMPALFGKFSGKIVSLLFAAYFLFSAVLAVWRLEDFVVGTLIPETPEFAVRVLFLIGIAYGAFSGSTPLIRTNAYILPLGVIVIVSVIGLPMGRMDPSYLLPIFEHGYRPMFNGAILLLGYLCQIPLVIMMLHRHVKSKFLHNSAQKAVLGLLVVTLAMEIGALGTLAAFGPEHTAAMYYPSFAVARIISVGGFMEHIEVIFVGVWVASIFITATFYVQAFGDSISDIFSQKGKIAKTLVLTGTILLLLFWPLFFDLSIYSLIRLVRDVATPAGLVIGGALPLLMLARIVVAPLKQKNQTSDESGPSNNYSQNKGSAEEEKGEKVKQDQSQPSGDRPEE